jgi:hypothetical protein
VIYKKSIVFGVFEEISFPAALKFYLCRRNGENVEGMAEDQFSRECPTSRAQLDLLIGEQNGQPVLNATNYILNAMVDTTRRRFKPSTTTDQ